MPGVTPRSATSASPLERMLSAMRVKSPFSHSALFGFIGANLRRPRRPRQGLESASNSPVSSERCTSASTSSSVLSGSRPRTKRRNLRISST